MEQLKEQLKRGYFKKDGCKEIGLALMHCETKEEMVKLYLTHPNWCLERNYPHLDFIRKAFADFENENMGVFIDKKFKGEVFNGQVGIFHNCTGTLHVEMDYENAVIPMLYFANDCRMTIVCEQENIRAIRVPLHIFGDCHISARSDDNAEFVRYNYDML